ncbi:hypothetical protein TRICI_001306 [Trichomonascus ciferrii]|uniref:PH-like domain-containing protein n=1 Tax=Trichomonascus ciferrii TaxID=44093 RepID=A0A642V8V6_9ASCO|nr:hypothetical protein TRICI_001306 [Trichomonascus ciferrii]
MSESEYNNNLNFGTGVQQAPVPLKFSPFSHRHDSTNDDNYVMSDFSESSSNIGGPVKGSSTSSSSASDEDDSSVDLSDFLTTERGYVEQLTSLLSYMERREQKNSDLYDTIRNIKRIHSISKETWSIESWIAIGEPYYSRYISLYRPNLSDDKIINSLYRIPLVILMHLSQYLKTVNNKDKLKSPSSAVLLHTLAWQAKLKLEACDAERAVATANYEQQLPLTESVTASSDYRTERDDSNLPSTGSDMTPRDSKGTESTPVLTLTSVRESRANKISFSNVKQFDTFECTTASFDPRMVVSRCHFMLSLVHPKAGDSWVGIPVEALLLAGINGSNKQLVLCSIENPGRSLLFPPFVKGELTYSDSDSDHISIVLKNVSDTSRKIILTRSCTGDNDQKTEQRVRKWQEKLSDVFPCSSPKATTPLPPRSSEPSTTTTDTAQKRFSSYLTDNSIGLGLKFSDFEPLDLSFSFSEKIQKSPPIPSPEDVSAALGEAPTRFQTMDLPTPPVGGGETADEVRNESKNAAGAATPEMDDEIYSTPVTPPEPEETTKPIKNTRFKLTPERISIPRNPTPTGSPSTSIQQRSPETFQIGKRSADDHSSSTPWRYSTLVKKPPLNKDKQLPPGPPLGQSPQPDLTMATKVTNKPLPPKEEKDKNFTTATNNNNDAFKTLISSSPQKGPPTLPLPSLDSSNNIALPKFDSKTSLSAYLLSSPKSPKSPTKTSPPPPVTEELPDIDKVKESSEAIQQIVMDEDTNNSSKQRSVSQPITNEPTKPRTGRKRAVSTSGAIDKRLPPKPSVKFDIAATANEDDQPQITVEKRTNGHNNYGNFVRKVSGGWKNLSNKLKKGKRPEPTKPRMPIIESDECDSLFADNKLEPDIEVAVSDNGAEETTSDESRSSVGSYRTTDTTQSPEIQSKSPSPGNMQLHYNRALNNVQDHRLQNGNMNESPTKAVNDRSIATAFCEETSSLSVADGVGQLDKKEKLVLFRGVSYISQWQNNSWMSLQSGELHIEVSVSGEGGMIIGYSPTAGDTNHNYSAQTPVIIVSLSPKNEIKKSTALDIQVYQTNHITMFRLRSGLVADRFHEAVQMSKLDVSNQPLLYAKRANASAPSLAAPSMTSSNSSLGSVSTAIPPPPPPPVPSEVQATPSPIFSDSFGQELLLLNKLKCKLHRKEATGKWSQPCDIQMTVYSVAGSSRKKLLLYNTTDRQTIFNQALRPSCFNRVGKVGISIRREDEESGPAEIIFMVQTKGDREARYVNDLLTSE